MSNKEENCKLLKEFNSLRSKMDEEICNSKIYKQLLEDCTKLEQENDRLRKENSELECNNAELKQKKTAGRKPNSERLKQKYDEIMRLKAEGKTQSEICELMSISRATYFRYQKYNKTKDEEIPYYLPYTLYL